MPEKDPNTYSTALVCVMVFAAFVGGFTRWVQKFKDPAVKVAWSVMELIAHLTMAIMAGGLAFIAARHFELGTEITVGLISVSSYFGGESVEITRQIVLGLLKRQTGVQVNDTETKP